MSMSPWEVLAEPRRRRLVRLCADRPRTVSELHSHMPEVTLGAVSQHLSRLRGARVLAVQRHGRQRVYRVEAGVLRQLHDELDEMWSASLDRLSALAQQEERRNEDT